MLTVLVPFADTGTKDELAQEPGSSGVSLSWRTKPVDGAGHETKGLLPSELILSLLIAGVPATSTGSEVTTGWPVM